METSSRKRHHPDWSQADWKQNNATIAATLGVTERSVSKHRGSDAPDTRWITGRVSREAAEVWGKVDWGHTTKAIAQQLGKSMSQVSIQRRIMAPETVRTFRGSWKPDEKWLAVDWRKNNNALARELGVAYNSVRWARMRYMQEMVELGKEEVRELEEDVERLKQSIQGHRERLGLE